MPILNEADVLYLGNQAVVKVQMGDVKVWPPLEVPETIPGLTAWFDATKDASRFSDGQKITSYVEHSPAQRVFAASAVGTEPTFRANSIGGKPRLDFAGSTGMYSAAWNAGPDGITLVMVSQSNVPSNHGMLLVHGPDADGIEMRFAAGTFNMQLVVRYGAYSIYWQPAFTMQANVDYINMLRVTRGVVSEHWFNNAEHSTGPGPPAMFNVPYPIYIGRRQGGYYYNGLVAEALVFSGPISDTDRIRLTDYLTEKWELP